MQVRRHPIRHGLGAVLGGVLTCHFWYLDCVSELTVLTGNFQNASMVALPGGCLECCLDFIPTLSYLGQCRGTIYGIYPRLLRLLFRLSRSPEAYNWLLPAFSLLLSSPLILLNFEPRSRFSLNLQTICFSLKTSPLIYMPFVVVEKE